MGGDGGKGGRGVGVEGVQKASVARHLAAVAKALLLEDRFFPDAFVPSSLVSGGEEKGRGAS